MTLRNRRIRSLLPVALLAAAPLVRADAQTSAPACAQQLVYVQDACQKAADVFALLAPQLGASIAGGSAILGQTGALGGFPHFTIGLRANGLRGALPRPQGVTLSLNGRQATAFRTESQWVGLPAAEGAVGIFKGIPLGLTNVGGVDLLVSASYLPDVDGDDFSVETSGGGLQLGYGARLGILQETAIVPGVSATFLRRSLPTTSIIARVGNDSVLVNDIKSHTDSWRLQAGKRFVLLGLSLGVGQDRYDSRANTGVILHEQFAGVNLPPLSANIGSVAQKLTRTNVFGGASLNFPFVRVAGEIGRASGGTLDATYNTFGDRQPDDAHTYGSVGVRVQF